MTEVPILTAMAAAGRRYAPPPALAFVNETFYTEATQSATGTVTPANTPGNLLALCVSWRTTGLTVVNVGSPGSNTDPGGNVWTQVSNQGGIAVWATLTTAVAGLVTVTLSSGACTKVISCIEVSGATGAHDVVGFGQAASTSPTASTGATVHANNINLAWVAQQTSSATFSGQTAGYTPLTQHISTEATKPMLIQGAYEIVAATGTQTYGLSSTSAVQWLELVAPFKGF